MEQQPIVKHAIISTPQVQAQLFVYDDGVYSSIQMNEDPNSYYIVGKSGINAVGLAGDPFRAIWVKPIVEILVEQLNQKFPAPEPEKTVDTAENA